MASKKTKTRRDPEDSDQVTVTATHEIRTDEQGNLLSCIEIESGDETPLPSDLRYLANQMKTFSNHLISRDVINWQDRRVKAGDEVVARLVWLSMLESKKHSLT